MELHVTWIDKLINLIKFETLVGIITLWRILLNDPDIG